MTLLYLDASALVKLVREEAESRALRTYLDGADLVSSELALTEVPRAVHRAAAQDPSLPLATLLAHAAELLDGIAMCPADQGLLMGAGAFAEPALRALDAIHLASAIRLSPIDAFVTYDERQAGAARLAGLRTMAPGA